MAGEHGDLLRDAVALVVRELMDAEVTHLTGADRGERSAERLTNLSGYRRRVWGPDLVRGIASSISPTRVSSFFPSLLGPRSRCEQAIVSVVMEAYVNGVSAGKVDRLVEQLGISAMSKDRVSRMCRELEEHVQEFRTRPWKAPIRTCGATPSTSRSATAAASSPRPSRSPAPSTRRARGDRHRSRRGRV